MGKFSMATWSIVGANSWELVLTCGTSALTTTVALAEPTLRRAEISVTLPTCTMTCSALNGVKPCTSTETVYVAGWSLPTRK